MRPEHGKLPQERTFREKMMAINQQFVDVSDSVSRFLRTITDNVTGLFRDVIESVLETAPHHQVIIGMICVIFAYVCVQALTSRPRL